MQIRRQELSWTLIFLAGLTTCSGCQFLSGSLAKLQNKDSKPTRDIARGPTGPMRDTSFTSAKPTALQKADVQIAFARTIERDGDREGAMKIYQQIIHSAPEHPAAYHRLAVLHDQGGNHAEALRYYQEALRRDPQNAELYADRGYSFYLQQNWPEAEQNLRRALQLDSTLNRAHNNLGLLLARTGRHDASLMEFQLAGCSEPECRANLVHAMMLEQRWNEAQQQCEIALASHTVPADLEKKLQRFQSLIAEAKHATPPPPSLPTAGQQSSHPHVPAAARPVSYESVQDFTALPRLVPTEAYPAQPDFTNTLPAPSQPAQ